MDPLSHPEYVIKKGRPHGHRYGKKPGDKEHYLANQFEKKCKKKFKEFMMLSVCEWVKTIELKKFVDDGMFLQMKITLIISQKRNTSTTRTKWWIHLNKSGSDTLPLRKRSGFKQAFSTLQQEDGGEQFAPTPYWKNRQWKSASSSSSTLWNWQDSWWPSSKNSECQGRCKQSLGQERWDPLLTVLWWKPQKMAFKNSIFYYRYIVYRWQRSTVTDGWV